jgi:hypothetical protein
MSQKAVGKTGGARGVYGHWTADSGGSSAVAARPARSFETLDAQAARASLRRLLTAFTALAARMACRMAKPTSGCRVEDEGSFDLGKGYGVEVDDDAIRSLVKRLGRAHPSGGTVVERAAVLAEGAEFEVVMAWIVAHGGEPEAAVPRAAKSGLHGLRVGDSGASEPRAASRFVLPPGALG